MEKLINTHPGEILKEEFLDEMGITPYRLSKGIKVQQTRISQLIKGKNNISVDMAIRLGRYFGNSAEFWLNLQRNHDLRKVKNANKELFESIEPYKQTV